MIYRTKILPARPAVHMAALLCALALSGLPGCSTEGGRKLPFVYRPDIQQGNIIEQEMLDRLHPGMDKNQVRFIMGTPALTDPFHADRWDYVFTYSKGGKRREQRHVTLYFKDEKLAYAEGDVKIGERPQEESIKPQSALVDVPAGRNKPGIFSRMFNAIPFVGDDDKPRKKAAPDTDDTDTTPEEDTTAAKDTTPASGGSGKSELPDP